jgi:PadR family transcriptional regulator PadR
MQRKRPPSGQAQEVLDALSAEPKEWRYGYDLCQQTGLKAGSMYPILMRLADRGWLETAWESGTPAGRPPRHLYRLTKTGLAQAKELASARAEASLAKRATLRPQTGRTP